MIADVLAARGRAWGLHKPEECDEFKRRALEVYRRNDDTARKAITLFSLSVGSGTDAEKFAYAVEGAEMFRLFGDYKHSATLLNLAMFNAEDNAPPETVYVLALQGLRDGLTIDKPGSVRFFLEYLAKASRTLNRPDLSNKYETWHSRFEVSNLDAKTPKRDPTPEERAAMVEIKAFLDDDDQVNP